MGRSREIFPGIASWLRIGEAIREHGFTVLFCACAVLVAYASRASFELHDFDGRVISQATLADVSVAGRTSLYTSSIAVFLGAAFAAILGFRLVGRCMSPRTRALLETLSICGLIFLYLAAYRVFATATLELVAGFQAWVFLAPLIERSIARRELELDRKVYLAWIVTTAICLCFPVFAFLGADHPRVSGQISLLVVGFGFALHVIVCWMARTGDRDASSSRVERFIWASMPVCLLPAVGVLHVESYLLLNNAGFANAPAPKTILLGMCGVLLVWAVARARRAPADPERLERMLGCRSFPIALAGIVAITGYKTLVVPWTDFTEAGNPGLLIQQWFDFGRWPFFETFDAHGLSDSFFGLVYAAITGFRDESWQFYDHAADVIGVVAAYFVMARVTGSFYVAVFVVLFLPYLEALFPHHFILALPTVFVLRWALVRDEMRVWFLFFLYLGFCVLWQIDVGVATCAASFATLLAVRFVSADERWSFSKAAGGAALAVSFSLSLAIGLALVKGVRIGPLTRDLLNILNSNQGFGYALLTKQRNDVFVWHHFLIPVAIGVLAYVGYARWRGRLQTREPFAYAFIALTFMAAYYYANFPRGLVRHSFMEPGIVYLASFAFAFLSLSVYGLTRISPRASFACFLIASSTLAYNFSIDQPAEKTPWPRYSLYEVLAVVATNPPTVAPSPDVIDRSPFGPRFLKNHVGAILPFLQANLEPEQTFLDLSNSPMLYVYSHRRSPHYLNHVLLANNDYLQQRVLEEVQQHDVPLVLLTTEASLCQAAGTQYWGEMDGIPFRLRQYRLHEYVYAHYQPLCLVQRWHVWARRDWTMPAAPIGDDRKVLWSSGGAEPDVPLQPDRAFYVRITGTSPRGGTIELTWRTEDEHGARNESRTLHWPAGKHERFFVLPPRLSACRLDRLALDGARSPGLTLDAFELVSMASNPYTSISAPVLAPVSDELRFLPYVWGRYDALSATRVDVRSLLGSAPESAPQTIDADAARTFSFDPIEPWDPACYVVLRMRTVGASTSSVVVDYGEGEIHRGRFVFQPAPDREEHEYVVRASVQYDWNASPKNRITVTPRGGAIELSGLTIARGD